MPSHEVYLMSLLCRTCLHDVLDFWGIHVIHTLHYMSSYKMQCKLVEYKYTYAPRPIPMNICILIRLAPNPYPSQIIHHNALHALCFVSCFFACKATTPGLVSDARSYNFLDLHLFHPWGFNPRGSFWIQELQLTSAKSYNSLDLQFLRPTATTIWTYTCSTHEAPTPRLIQHTWFRYASGPTLSVLCVHVISHANHHNSCSVHNSILNMLHVLSFTNHEISTLHMAQQHTIIHVSISIHNHLSQHTKNFYNISHHSSIYWKWAQTYIFIQK
jgi:hypothetical protein